MKWLFLTAGIVALLVAGDALIAQQAPSFESIEKTASARPRLRSVLVSHRGHLVFERYFNGARSTQAANIKSASKSVISALVGIALDRKLIPDLKTPIVTYFPELAKDPDPRNR